MYEKAEIRQGKARALQLAGCGEWNMKRKRIGYMVMANMICTNHQQAPKGENNLDSQDPIQVQEKCSC